MGGRKGGSRSSPANAPISVRAASNDDVGITQSLVNVSPLNFSFRNSEARRNFAARVTTTSPSWKSPKTLPEVPIVRTTFGSTSATICRNRSFTGRVAVPSPVRTPSWFRWSSDLKHRTDVDPIVVGK